MTNLVDYLHEQNTRLLKARETMRVLDQQTATRIALDKAASQVRIPPKRIDPPAPPPLPPARTDPFLQAIAQRLKLGH